MAVNLTNITNVETLQQGGQYANDATGGIFWGIVIIGIFIIIFMNLRREGTAYATAAASFATFSLSLTLFFLKWLNMLYPIILGLILAGTLFVIRFSERR